MAQYAYETVEQIADQLNSEFFDRYEKDSEVMARWALLSKEEKQKQHRFLTSVLGVSDTLKRMVVIIKIAEKIERKECGYNRDDLMQEIISFYEEHPRYVGQQ